LPRYARNDRNTIPILITVRGVLYLTVIAGQKLLKGVAIIVQEISKELNNFVAASLRGLSAEAEGYGYRK
jgi:hypothetical protein